MQCGGGGGSEIDRGNGGREKVSSEQSVGSSGAPVKPVRPARRSSPYARRAAVLTADGKK